MAKTALLVGGTAATGMAIAAEISKRGYDLTIYHRGTHEVPSVMGYEHIHGDPHFTETIQQDLGDRKFDLVVATYGRIRLIAEHLVGKTGRLITVGGSPVAKKLPGLPGYESDGYIEEPSRLVDRMIETEQRVIGLGAEGHYVSTVIRYPYVYGPYSIISPEWHVIKRVHDNRKRWLMPGGGMGISTRIASPNAAHVIGLAIDKPEAAGGQIYQAAEDKQYSFRDWTAMTAKLMGYEFEFVDVPWAVMPPPPEPGTTFGNTTFSAVPAGGGPRSSTMLSNFKTKLELGYADIVDHEEWMKQTIEYWLANPPAVDGEGNHMKPEEFDYAAEDQLLAWWDSVVASIPRDVGTSVGHRHPYPHPKAPGEQPEGS